ncbi:MAG TPA: type III PLP-dependent enzyme [Pilimelia sp.]|nr:type III PLP-dependent enzyme [Pilimelia sp.]
MPDTATATTRAGTAPDGTALGGATAAGATLGPALARLVADGLATPAYAYDLAEVRAGTARLRAALPAGSALYYSLKANPHPMLLRELRELGTRPEVCSPGELDAATDTGWPAADVLYTGPGKRDADLAYALSRGVREFSVDSPAGLAQLAAAARARRTEARALLRVNGDQPGPGQGLAMTGVTSQFGADLGWVLAAPTRFASRPGAEVVGLHLYMGTNMTTVDDLLAQFALSLRAAVRIGAALRPHGVRLRVLDLGGGFGAPFARAAGGVDLAGLGPRLSDLLDAELPGWRAGDPALVFESGRYLVAAAGTLLVRVLDAKRSHGRQVVVLDAGINHLGGMSGLRRLPPLTPDLVALPGVGPRSHGPSDTGPVPGGAGRGAPVPTLVAGPLCTPLDTWARQTPLPPLRPGDLLAVPNVGAYGLYASLVAFLGHPLPVEVVLDGARPQAPPRDVSRLVLRRVPADLDPGADPRPGTDPRPGKEDADHG